MDPQFKEDPEIRDGEEMGGGRRRKHKGTKKRKEPSVLASWRKFVRKVQHEEKITYPEAMKRASKRKSEWQRGGSPDDVEEGEEQMGGSTSDVQDFDGQYNQYGSVKVGGRSRRRSRGQRGGVMGTYSPASVGGSRHSRGQRGGVMATISPASVGGSRRRGTKKRR